MITYTKNESTNFSTLPLIDKVTIKGFRLISHNDELVKRSHYLESFDSETGERIVTVKIKDSYIDALHYLECGTRFKSTVQLSINNPEYSNLYCMTVEDLQEKLVNVKGYIANNYGLDFDFSESVASMIEINKTFRLKDEYNLYNDSISTIRTLIEGSTNKAFIDVGEVINNRFFHNSKYFKVSRYEVKMYNKSAEMKSKHIKVESNIMRFEITCKNKRAIERFFGTTKVFDMKQEVLNEKYNEWIVESVIHPVQKYLEENIKELSMILQKHNHYDSSQKYIQNFLAEVHAKEADSLSCLLSLGMLDDVVKGCTFKSNSQRSESKKQGNIRNQRMNHFKRLADTMFPEWHNDKYAKVREILANLN